MGQQLSPEMDEIKEQISLINAQGISTEQLMTVVDGIINGDLTNKNYKPSGIPLVQAKDKQKEADRILNNYSIALASLAADKKSGKNTEQKSLLKLSIIVGAASTALNMLGFQKDDINNALGLTGAAKN